jgi:hypothetical protein
MLEKGVISAKQFEKLVFIFTVGSSISGAILSSNKKQNKRPILQAYSAFRMVWLEICNNPLSIFAFVNLNRNAKKTA